VVPEQREADPDFPTVEAPNPEERAALGMAVALAGRQRADLVIATDADGDRLGVACRNREGGYDLLTGNQAGCLLMAHRLRQAATAGALTGTTTWSRPSSPPKWSAPSPEGTACE
jgi:phosphoglucomutase